MAGYGIREFKKHSHRKLNIIIAMGILTAISAVVTLKIDLGHIGYKELLHIIFNKNDPSNDLINGILIWDLGIPRILSCILAGFALGIAGAVMQCVLKNPLGSPYTLGISNAAAFGASVGIVILGGGMISGQSHATISIDNPYIVTASAFAWSMIATGVIILLVRITKVSPETMVLAGVALSSIFSAGISLLQYMFNEYALSTIVFWQFGSMGKAGWNELTLIAAVSLAAISFFLYSRMDYNALDAGDEVASSLGVNVNGLRLTTLFMSALLTSVVVSFMGIVAFIGLLGPHMVRRFVGNDHRYLLPGSMFVGATILLISDCIGQTAMDFTLPVGIITSFLGGPLFLYLLVRGYRKKKGRLAEFIKSKKGEE
ncbi:MAG: iron ABC transporter permease [Methanomethylophilus alvi]|nr:MAG: iron ABC transporter permease [Methanomethylophilus alvi]